MLSVNCPKCEAGFRVDILAAVGKDQRLSYRVYPESPGSMMQAKVIGGQLVAMDDLMRACARQDGGKVRTYIERVETHGDGSLEFHLAVLSVVAWDAGKGKFVAQAIEAHRAATAQQGSVEDESAVPTGCAP